jgi:hypothetical protein
MSRDMGTAAGGAASRAPTVTGEDARATGNGQGTVTPAEAGVHENLDSRGEQAAPDSLQAAWFRVLYAGPGGLLPRGELAGELRNSETDSRGDWVEQHRTSKKAGALAPAFRGELVEELKHPPAANQTRQSGQAGAQKHQGTWLRHCPG